MRLFKCEIYGVKFSVESLCEKWEVNETIKKQEPGWSTKRQCMNCKYMPSYEEMINEIDRTIQKSVAKD